MKGLVTIILFLHSLTHPFEQNTDIKLMVDSLKYLKTDTLDCTADLYWRIVSKGERAIPFLIDKLSDTTQTNISLSCKTTKLNVGEVAYFALQQIAFFPAFVITHIQFDVIYGNGCSSFFDYFFNNKNKSHYQGLTRLWYNNNKTKFKPLKIPKKKMTACQKRFNIDKYLMWTE